MRMSRESGVPPIVYAAIGTSFAVEIVIAGVGLWAVDRFHVSPDGAFLLGCLALVLCAFPAGFARGAWRELRTPVASELDAEFPYGREDRRALLREPPPTLPDEDDAP